MNASPDCVNKNFGDADQVYYSDSRVRVLHWASQRPRIMMNEVKRGEAGCARGSAIFFLAGPLLS
jgi:hypothetical protein